MSKEAEHICEQCGCCCLTVGRTFWKAGDLNSSKPFGSIELLNQWANDGDHEDNGLPCEMLYFVKGKAVCWIHARYGYDAKPVACKDYPDSELCFRQKALNGNEQGNSTI